MKHLATAILATSSIALAGCGKDIPKCSDTEAEKTAFTLVMNDNALEISRRQSYGDVVGVEVASLDADAVLALMLKSNFEPDHAKSFSEIARDHGGAKKVINFKVPQAGYSYSFAEERDTSSTNQTNIRRCLAKMTIKKNAEQAAASLNEIVNITLVSFGYSPTIPTDGNYTGDELRSALNTAKEELRKDANELSATVEYAIQLTEKGEAYVVARLVH